MGNDQIGGGGQKPNYGRKEGAALLQQPGAGEPELCIAERCFMNLSIVLNDLLFTDGTLKTYRFIPINQYNKIVVDRISDIHLDVKGNTDKDVGLLRIYNSDKCQLNSTTCKIRNFMSKENMIEFQFEHMYIPIESSNFGGCGFYNFILPLKYKLTELHIVDPFDKSTPYIEHKKHFRYQIYWDNDKELQIVQMELRSRRSSFSFILKGKASLYKENLFFLECSPSEISLDENIDVSLFDEEIKKSFWKNFLDSIILEPNVAGFGIDIKKIFRK